MRIWEPRGDQGRSVAVDEELRRRNTSPAKIGPGIVSLESLLTFCPSCRSGLIYPRDVYDVGGDSVVSRRCPECEHVDHVRCEPRAAEVWLQRERTHRRTIVRAVLEMELTSIVAPQQDSA